MISILAAAALFVGVHLLIAGTGLRDRLVRVLGEQAYLGVFSLLALGSMIWLCLSWAGAPSAAPSWNAALLRPAMPVLMLVAFLFAAIGLTTPSPTAAGGEASLEADEPAKGILRVTRHPFLWGVVLWGACHLALNSDVPSLLFFGALLLLALLGPFSIDAKRRRKHGERWDRYAAVTSNVPFAAILAGRNRFVPRELATWRIALAIILYAGFLAGHPMLFGVSAF